MRSQENQFQLESKVYHFIIKSNNFPRKNIKDYLNYNKSLFENSQLEIWVQIIYISCYFCVVFKTPETIFGFIYEFCLNYLRPEIYPFCYLNLIQQNYLKINKVKHFDLILKTVEMSKKVK